MTASLPELLSSLAAKSNLLAQRYSLVRDQRDKALAECRELEEQNENLRRQLQQAQTEIEYLRLSHKIAPTEHDARQAQEILTAMVKKIDKCIAKLRKD